MSRMCPSFLGQVLERKFDCGVPRADEAIRLSDGPATVTIRIPYSGGKTAAKTAAKRRPKRPQNGGQNGGKTAAKRLQKQGESKAKAGRMHGEFGWKWMDLRRANLGHGNGLFLIKDCDLKCSNASVSPRKKLVFQWLLGYWCC